MHNADEMQKLGMKIPLLIGGATTSRAHTAIKIAQRYEQPVVQVPDASLVVNVCNDLTHPDKREEFVNELKDKQEKARIRHENRDERKLLPLSEARGKGPIYDWKEQEIAIPSADHLGISMIEAQLEEVLAFFDWSPFFWAWQLKGRIPGSSQAGKQGRKQRNFMTKLKPCSHES